MEKIIFVREDERTREEVAYEKNLLRIMDAIKELTDDDFDNMLKILDAEKEKEKITEKEKKLIELIDELTEQYTDILMSLYSQINQQCYEITHLKEELRADDLLVKFYEEVIEDYKNAITIYKRHIKN